MVGGGSAGAVIAARLSEDPSVRVALVEAGGTPPPHEVMPAAVASLQLDPEVDWMYTGDPGGAGKGLTDGRMMVPRGKMLGGSSGLNYMAYVRGHPGDFDGWAADDGKGWSYDDVLPYFIKSEDLAPPDPPEGVVIDEDAHGSGGPLGVSVRVAPHRRGRAVRRRPPRRPGSRWATTTAATAVARPAARRSSRPPPATASGPRRTTRSSSRCWSGTNLTVITHAQVEQVLLEQDGAGLRATGVRYRDADGATHDHPRRPRGRGQRGRDRLAAAAAALRASGRRDELAAVGVECLLDNPHVGKHLKDHLHVPLASRRRAWR